jgi:hypothetical protein
MINKVKCPVVMLWSANIVNMIFLPTSWNGIVKQRHYYLTQYLINFLL